MERGRVMTCAVHGSTRKAQQADPDGEPSSGFYRIIHRITARMEPQIAAAFTVAVEKLRDRIDMTMLRSTLVGIDPKSSDMANVQAAVLTSRLGPIFSGQGVQGVIFSTMTLTGQAGADVLSDATGLKVLFNARDPNTVIAARTITADMIKAVTDIQKETVRVIVAAGADLGLTVEEQARAIREVVGLPPNWARAPLNMTQELRDGKLSVLRRRWSATDKAQIRSRIAAGTVNETFVSQMRTRYVESLTNRRALNIARTETIRAASAGQHEGWRQAIAQKALPPDVRRHWIVTPDERLRDTHAAVVDMNQDGVGMDEPFETPLGPVEYPPMEPLCRCAVGLSFPNQKGIL